MTTVLRWGHFASEFRFRFSHASASRAVTSNIIVEIRGRDGFCGYGEGCPRKYVTGETEETAAAFISKYGSSFIDAGVDIPAIENWIKTHELQISKNPAAFTAIELALLDVLARRVGKSVEEFLGHSSELESVQYTAVLGDSSPLKTGLAALAYSVVGFTSFKIKLNTDIKRDQRKLSWLPKHAKIRVDANNLWQDPEACIAHIRKVGRNIWGIEEPLEVGDINGLQNVGLRLDAAIILDESLINHAQLSQFFDRPGRWVANIRVSKCGGLLRSIALANAAQAQGMDVILGAHVGETSLLTRAAITVGKALKKAPMAREGAFGTLLLKRDISKTSLTFGSKGVLKPNRYSLSGQPGFGLEIDADRVSWAT